MHTMNTVRLRVHIAPVGFEIDPDTYKTGEDEVNDYLNKGFQFVREYQTASGLVIALGRFEKGRK